MCRLCLWYAAAADSRVECCAAVGCHERVALDEAAALDKSDDDDEVAEEDIGEAGKARARRTRDGTVCRSAVACPRQAKNFPGPAARRGARVIIISRVSFHRLT